MIPKRTKYLATSVGLAAGVTLVLTFITGRTPVAAFAAAFTRLTKGAGAAAADPRSLGSVITDPGNESYSASAMVQSRVKAKDVFARERRDEPWASSMEETIRRATNARVPPVAAQFSLLRVECRTASCAIEFAAPESQYQRAFRTLQDTRLLQDCRAQCDRDVKYNGMPTGLTICFGDKRNRDRYRDLVYAAAARRPPKATAENPASSARGAAYVQ